VTFEIRKKKKKKKKKKSFLCVFVRFGDAMRQQQQRFQVPIRVLVTLFVVSWICANYYYTIRHADSSNPLLDHDPSIPHDAFLRSQRQRQEKQQNDPPVEKVKVDSVKVNVFEHKLGVDKFDEKQNVDSEVGNDDYDDGFVAEPPIVQKHLDSVGEKLAAQLQRKKQAQEEGMEPLLSIDDHFEAKRERRAEARRRRKAEKLAEKEREQANGKEEREEEEEEEEEEEVVADVVEEPKPSVVVVDEATQISVAGSEWYRNYIAERLVREQALREKPVPACGHHASRSYAQHPIVVLGRNEGARATGGCDVPCEWSSRSKHKVVDARIGSSGGGCGHVYGVRQSMEAAYSPARPSGGPAQISSTTDLDSDVPAPYFSWHEYGFMERMLEKTEKAPVAAFISNCGARNNRLKYLQRMMDAGLKIDSMGRCKQTREFPAGKSNWFVKKIDTLRRYKFTIAFENTNIKDYVTEKLFQPLIAGSVPIHMGVSDVHKFAPAPNSVLSVHDFESPEALAARIKYLDTHDDEYEKMLEWKWKGYSPEFQAMVDLSSVHSACRICIEAADRHRANVGEPLPEARPFPEDEPGYVPPAGYVPIRVRERSKFWFRRVWVPPLESLELAQLIEHVEQRLKESFDAPNAYVFYLQTARRPHQRLTDASNLAKLLSVPDVELEAIVLTPPDFSHLREWYPDKYKN
jgi:flagellar biosynthesis GTPase FlhF